MHLEYGVHALGSDEPELAEKIAEHVRTWNREHRGGPGPRIAVYPVGTPDDRVPGLPGGHVIDKDHRRVTFSWPGPHHTLANPAQPVTVAVPDNPSVEES
ncbi:hypothetical protein ACFP1Z_12860 [Streptomyces gamaensis]|uniref:Uncharacterized protein n=1 Tax=Streptomyces gamaensis TaxID=1763542 RepID=A0ABW0Z215_9ACTN